MEGNEIEDLGGGAFRTATSSEKYSRLDLYAMGLATEAEVPRWFFIDAPISDRNRESGPIAGITINGTRRDVPIRDVIGALGPRLPAAADSPRQSITHQALIPHSCRRRRTPARQSLTNARSAPKMPVPDRPVVFDARSRRQPSFTARASEYLKECLWS